MQLDSLNKAQREAVCATEGAILVLAGAGSGKTRVLTMRAARLISLGTSPYEILALTFTNKAANEMAERIAALTPHAKGMWIGTFHSTCARILRMYADKIGYSANYTIYDESDAIALIKSILAEYELDPKTVVPKQVKYAVSRAKNADVSPSRYADEYPDDFNAERTAKLYKRYEERLLANNAMDFDDLLLKTLKLLRTCPDVLDYFGNRFRYIMVDEYQDTNLVQYEIVKLMSAYHGNLFVVGDDDQSIYGWRGANIQNILEFERDFPNARAIYLEQNYRSHQGILDVANEVISHNAKRKAKRLYSDRAATVKPEIYAAPTEYKEAEYVADRCRAYKRQGYGYDQMAVLYRTNSQSRVIEDEFKKRGIPYRIYGGVGFYDRKEIKDVVAYLNLIVNSSADMSFARIINVPRRGIGDATVERIRDYAAAYGVSMMEAAALPEAYLPTRSQSAVKKFCAVMEGLMEARDDYGLADYVDYLLDATGYMAELENDDSPEAVSRIDNLNEFLRLALEFEQNDEDGTLEGFLERNSLMSDVDSIGEEEGVVSMMTLHSAKGLEFDCVFIVGMENSLLPHSMSGEEGVEEERRLCYVGITRAREELRLSYAATRLRYASQDSGGMSREPRTRSMFLNEIPAELVNVVDERAPRAEYTRQSTPKRSFGSYAEFAKTKPVEERDTGAFGMGDRVYHEKFGQGVISGIKGAGKEKIAIIDFEREGQKKMFLAFTPLQKL